MELTLELRYVFVVVEMGIVVVKMGNKLVMIDVEVRNVNVVVVGEVTSSIESPSCLCFDLHHNFLQILNKNHIFLTFSLFRMLVTFPSRLTPK